MTRDNNISTKEEKIKNIISLLEAKRYATMIQSYPSGAEFLDVWEWAEATSNEEIQSKISGVLVSYWLNKTYKRTDTEVERWSTKFRSLADEAMGKNRPDIAAGYLQALSILTPNLEKKFNLDNELIPLYRNARNWDMLVHTMDSIRAWYRNHQKFDEAKKLCLEMYRISRDNKLDEGIGISLQGLGDYFKDEGQSENAAACYYLSWKILKNISERAKVPKNEYQEILSHSETEEKFDQLTPDDLIAIASKFKR